MKTRLFLAWMLLLGAPDAMAQPAANDFARVMAGFQSMSGDFVQTIYAESGGLIDSQQGHMSLQKPRLIRWETANPRQLMVCDGDTIYLYDPDLDQVIVRPWLNDPTQNPVSLFTSEVDLSAWFDIRRDEDGFRLTPLDESSLIERIEVRMDDAGRPSGLLVADRSGQVNDIEFSNLEFNVVFSESHFHFSPPEGAEVIVDDG